MRFNIAVSILAHQVLPLAGASDVSPSSTEEELREKYMQALLLDRRNENAGVREKKQSIARFPRSQMTRTEIGRSQHVSESLGAEECNPDIGILSCTDANARCVKSPQSTLGGFCIEYQKAKRRLERHLQDGGLCEDIYMDCDCSSMMNGIGSYTCYRPGECIDPDGFVCGSFEDVVTIQDTGAYSKSSCFTVITGGAIENSLDSPVESYCFTVVNDGIRTTECVLEIDGVQCDSCTPIECTGGSEAARVDCTNINAVASGDSCATGLNVLLLLEGALTPPPTPAPQSTPSPPTEDSQASTPEPVPESTPLPSPLPTSEFTSGASGFHNLTVLVGAVVLLAGALIVS